MNVGIRRAADGAFTGVSVGSVLLLVAALGVILGPMIVRGATAVFFRGTVEFRKMQHDLHGRGEASALEAEIAAAEQARRPVYDLLAQFRRGIDTSALEDEARRVYTELGKQLAHRDVDPDERLQARRLARQVRDTLIEAYEAADRPAAERHLAEALAHEQAQILRGTVAERLFDMAREYRGLLAAVDLGKRAEYAAALQEIQEGVTRLFGPRPGEPRPPLAMDRYGATRMDLAARWADRVLYAGRWVEVGPGQPLRRERVPREEQFAGTALEPLFPLARDNLEAMLRPRFTMYWQYLVDDSIPGHFFGGVGPEILGTLVITVLSILVALPLGLVSAAYLVEVAGRNPAVNLIRMCINTLAGVPSIVFGLFGLAFFVTYLTGRACVLAASLTLAVLVLPVIIRASEEAIRAVPPTYKEAALALGASRLRCFLTVQLPAALPGVLTGVILAMSRAAGETAPVLFTGAVAVGPVLSVFRGPPVTAAADGSLAGWLLEQTRTLSYGGYDLAVGDRIAAMVPHQQYGMVTALILLVLALNALAILVRSRVARRLRGQ